MKYSLKALDAIHLASVLWFREEIEFVCSGKNFIKSVQLEGFKQSFPFKRKGIDC